MEQFTPYPLHIWFRCHIVVLCSVHAVVEED